MADLHPINQSLVTLVGNQIERTKAAFEGLDASLWNTDPGVDCNSIHRIASHLLHLRHFTLKLMDSPLAQQVPLPESIETPEEFVKASTVADELLLQAIREHDSMDWNAVPAEPRPGLWGEHPTLYRICRPLNDYVNHLGGVRVIRRIYNNPAERTQ